MHRPLPRERAQCRARTTSADAIARSAGDQAPLCNPRPILQRMQGHIRRDPVRSLWVLLQVQRVRGEYIDSLRVPARPHTQATEGRRLVLSASVDSARAQRCFTRTHEAMTETHARAKRRRPASLACRARRNLSTPSTAH
jgi:hypothetical protein